MFKKKISLGKESLLSSKDKKSLQKRLQGLEIFSKNSKLKQISVSGTRTKIYFEEVDSNWISILIESTVLLPTIYSLWRNPSLLPVVYIWSPVSCYLLNGADLMWPGVANPEEVLKLCQVGSVVAVSVVGNVPMAVGVIASICSPGIYKGRCVEVLHCYRDELWIMNQSVPNQGFTIEIVVGVEREGENQDDSEESVENEEKKEAELQILEEKLGEEIKIEGEEEKEREGEGEEVGAMLGNTETKEEIKENQEKIEQDIIGDTDGDLSRSLEHITPASRETENLNDIKISEDNLPATESSPSANKENFVGCSEEIKKDLGEKEEEMEEEEESKDCGTTELKDSIFSKTPDEKIMAIFLTALKIGVTDSMLPLEPSAVLSLMNRSKRNLEINFSETSYKKLGKFLQHAHELKVVAYEKPKSHDHKLIVSVNKSHTLLAECVPIVSKLKAIAQDTGDKEKEKLIFKREEYPKILFTPGFIPKSQYSYIFNKVIEHNGKVLASKAETSTLLQEYITLNNLECTKNTVKLDQNLRKALKCEEEVKKSELFKNFRNLFDEGYIEEYTSGLMPSNIRPGQIPVITISVEKSKYKKVVTRVKGCDDYLVDMKEILGISQRALAASANLSEKISKNKVKIELQIQGDHISKIVEILTDVFMIPKSHIQINRNR